MDLVIIVVGFLYDVVEDIEIILKDLEKVFNEEVVMLVDGVMKFGKIKYKFKEE